MVETYELFLRGEGKKQTTIAIQMRTLRAIINEAKRDGIIKEQQYPFGRGKYEIQEGEGRKLALTLEQIGKKPTTTTAPIRRPNTAITGCSYTSVTGSIWPTS